LGDSYRLTVGNLVRRDEGDRVSKRVESINRMKEEELRDFKINQRAQPRRDGKHGANIGLIHVALQAENPITYHLKEIDAHYSFLLLNIKVSKLTQTVEQLA
jgi:hypothetical protein